MSLLRDNPNTFKDALTEANVQFGIALRQIEKDYWVTAVLRELVRLFDRQFLFKGGTSLSKAYRLIDRFSEDIDILLLSAEGEATDSLLNEMQEAAASVCGFGYEVEKAVPGMARRILVNYAKLPNTPRARGTRLEIVLEPGIRGGPHPNEQRTIATLVGEILQISGDYEDLEPFEIAVLHPARTMVEKMFNVDSLARRLLADPSERLRSTEGRHFYDLFHLWDEDRCNALEWLSKESNKDLVYEDCILVSQRWFPDKPDCVPAGGFATSVAFMDDSIIDRISAGYESALDEVCYPGTSRPTLAEVRDRARSLIGRI